MVWGDQLTAAIRSLCLHHWLNLGCRKFGICKGIDLCVGDAARKDLMVSADNFPIPVAAVWHGTNLKMRKLLDDAA
jgi:hypothetical protein